MKFFVCLLFLVACNSCGSEKGDDYVTAEGFNVYVDGSNIDQEAFQNALDRIQEPYGSQHSTSVPLDIHFVGEKPECAGEGTLPGCLWWDPDKPADHVKIAIKADNDCTGLFTFVHEYGHYQEIAQFGEPDHDDGGPFFDLDGPVKEGERSVALHDCVMFW